MIKINVTLDVSKINKSKIVERKYTNKAGAEITAKEYKVDVVPLNVPKLVKETDTWTMHKTHFVVEAKSKEEIANSVPDTYVGEGFTFKKKEAIVTKSEDNGFDYPDEDINVEDIPF